MCSYILKLWCMIDNGKLVNEPPHDKISSVVVRTAKTQINLGIHPVWSESLWRLGSAWASAQSDQNLRCPHEESLGPELPIECKAKTLIRLGGCPGWSESLQGAHSFCCFCHVLAQITGSSAIMLRTIWVSRLYTYGRTVGLYSYGPTFILSWFQQNKS